MLQTPRVPVGVGQSRIRRRRKSRSRRARSRFALLGVVLPLIYLTESPSWSAGRQWYVAVSASASNDGSLSRPLDLATALSRNSPAGPGDTIWVRGGVYRGRFASNISGSPSAPIIVRNYPGERATIDNASDCSSYVINGDYTWHWGLEVTSSGVRRRTPHGASDCGDESLSTHLDRGVGIRNNGTFTKVINSVVHDTQVGVSNWGTWTSDPGLEVYGSLFYYNGWEQTPIGRGHGQGLYITSKKNGPTVVRDNIVHTQFSQGIRSGDDPNFSPTIEGNISYLNGAHMHAFGNGRNIYVGGSNDGTGAYEPLTGAVIQHNYTYHRPNRAPYAEGLNAGLWWPGASGRIVGNYVAGAGGGHALQLGYVDAQDAAGSFTATACSGNVVYGPVNPYTRQQCPPESNVYHESKPGTNAVFVRANQYERGRAHIAIYNWENLASVAVNIAASGLLNGQAYEVRDAMNFYGAPVARGTYNSGGPTVSIPMTGLARAPLSGEDDITPAYRPLPHSAPEFGAFVLLPA